MANQVDDAPTSWTLPQAFAPRYVGFAPTPRWCSAMLRHGDFLASPDQLQIYDIFADQSRPHAAWIGAMKRNWLSPFALLAIGCASSGSGISGGGMGGSGTGAGGAAGSAGAAGSSGGTVSTGNGGNGTGGESAGTG